MPERRSKTSTVLVVWASLEFVMRDTNNFLSRLVTMDETWLYHDDPQKKQQSVDWGHRGSPVPKKSECKIRLKISRLDFLESRRHPPHWLSSKGANYQRRELVIPAGAIKGHFEGKTPREIHEGCLVLDENTPSHWALASQKKLAYLAFQCFDHPLCSPDLAPTD